MVGLVEGDKDTEAVAEGVVDNDPVGLADAVRLVEGDKDTEGVAEGVLDSDPEAVTDAVRLAVVDGLVVADVERVGVPERVDVSVRLLVALRLVDDDAVGVVEEVRLTDGDHDAEGVADGELDAELHALEPTELVVPVGHGIGSPVPAGQKKLSGGGGMQGWSACMRGGGACIAASGGWC